MVAAAVCFLICREKLNDQRSAVDLKCSGTSCDLINKPPTSIAIILYYEDHVAVDDDR